MFIDEWFQDGFYGRLSASGSSSSGFGQFFWTHAYYPHENLQLWRPVTDPNDPTKTIATNFRIEAAGQDAFRRGFPLANPRLESTEEFLVVRAKRRPVVLIRPELPSLGSVNRGFRGRVNRQRCLVAQVFGLADPETGAAKFSRSFVDRVRKMEWPQFMFLPSKPGLLRVDSLLRLDEVQSVFTPHLDSAGWSLGDEASEILSDQLVFLLTGNGPNQFTDLREMLINQ